MMIKTRIRCGYIIFAALLAALAGYQSYTAYKVLSLNKTLAQTGFHGAFTCLDLLRLDAQVEENVKKWSAQEDESSSAGLKESNDDFAASLNQLKSEAVLGKTQQETERLVQFWNQFTSDLESQKQALPGDQSIGIPAELEEDLQRVETQIQTVYQTSLDAISSQVEASNKATQNAARNSWLVAVGALVLGVLLSFWHYRSITLPLSQLDEGTQAIAGGKLFIKMDTSRRDEFSRIAKNINDLTQRLRKLDPSAKSPDKTD
jgi:nitrate/nitrite-specific signal transduction histidine kinase